MGEPYKPKSEAGKRVMNALNESFTELELPDNPLQQPAPQKSFVELADEIAEGLTDGA